MNTSFLFHSRLSQKYDLPQRIITEEITKAKRMMMPLQKHICVNNEFYHVTKTGAGPIITPFGRFFLLNFHMNDRWQQYRIIIKATMDATFALPIFDPSKEIFLRIDSGCSPGQIYHDQRCDCREQMSLALQLLAKADQGIIIHIPEQSGRGKGMDFQLATLYLEETLGLDTIEAFTAFQGEDISLDKIGRAHV